LRLAMTPAASLAIADRGTPPPAPMALMVPMAQLLLLPPPSLLPPLLGSLFFALLLKVLLLFSAGAEPTIAAVAGTDQRGTLGVGVGSPSSVPRSEGGAEAEGVSASSNQTEGADGAEGAAWLGRGACWECVGEKGLGLGGLGPAGTGAWVGLRKAAACE